MGRGAACRSVRRAPTGQRCGHTRRRLPARVTACGQRARPCASTALIYSCSLTSTAAHIYSCSPSSASALPSAVSPRRAQAQRSSSALAHRAGACPAPPRPHSSKAFCPDPSRRPPMALPGARRSCSRHVTAGPGR